MVEIGKSKIFRILEALLRNQCSHEHLEHLSGSKSGNKNTIQKLTNCTCNVSEDQQSVKYLNTGILTRIISGEPISLETKVTSNTYLQPYATMLFSINEVIDFKGVGLHITDRFVVIPFNATFTDSKGNCDINIGEEICKPLPLQIIATRAILAFCKVLKNGKFTIPSNVEAETKRYFMECNSVLEFCNTFPITTFISKSRYYLEYCNWCSQNNYKELTNSLFGKYVLALGCYRSERYSFKGKRNMYYVNLGFNNNRTFGIQQAFYADREEQLIESHIELEDYLWKRIEDERIRLDEEIRFDEEIPLEEEIIFD